MRKTYPMTPTQMATARRRGWTVSRDGKKWTKPKSFTPSDQRRIEDAEARRARRQRGAD